jgi:hypothetical protein
MTRYADISISAALTAVEGASVGRAGHQPAAAAIAALLACPSCHVRKMICLPYNTRAAAFWLSFIMVTPAHTSRDAAAKSCSYRRYVPQVEVFVRHSLQ